MMPQALYAEYLTSRAVSVKLYTEFIIPGLPSLLRGQSLIVQTLRRGIHRINHYPADRYLGLVIIYHRGLGGFWGEDHLIFRRTKGRSVVTENPEGGITENFRRLQMVDHSNWLGK